MKDHLLELIEGIVHQMDGRIPMDNPSRDAIVLIHDALDDIRIRLSQLEINQHNKELRDAGIQLEDTQAF